MVDSVSYKSDILRVAVLFVVAFEYFVQAPMFLKWTFRKLRYETLYNHFGCYTFTTCGFLALAILAACGRQAKAADWYFWVCSTFNLLPPFWFAIPLGHIS